MPCRWQSQPAKWSAAEMLLVEAEALDLRAHGAVEDEDALARRRRERGKHLGAVGYRSGMLHRRGLSWSVTHIIA